MKKILFFTLLTNLLFAQSKQNVTTTIQKVTLFTQGAQVNRIGKTTVSKGKTIMVFDKLSPDLDPQSVQVKGDGNFTIVSVQHQMNYLNEQSRRDEIKTLIAQREFQQANAKRENSILTVYQQEEKMLLLNQTIGGQNVGLKASDLREAVDFQRLRLSEVLLKQLDIQKNIQQIDSNINKLTRQLATLNQKQLSATAEILVTIVANDAVNAGFELTYFVGEAGWFATYDLRVKDINSPIDVSFKANVRQNSGEDWKDVKLVISNGNPTEGAIAPTLVPWRLSYDANYYNSANYNQLQMPSVAGRVLTGRVVEATNGEALIGANVIVKGTTVGSVTDIDGRFSLSLPRNAREIEVNYAGFEQQAVLLGATNEITIAMKVSASVLEEVVVVGYGQVRSSDMLSRTAGISTSKKQQKPKPLNELEVREIYQPTTTNFAIELPYTIPTDGKVYTVDVKRMDVAANYRYYSAPKLDKDAFLTAQVVDWQELNLTDGEASLYFEGAYLGKSILDLTNASDTLQLSLGRDKGVVIERKRVKEFTNKHFLSQYKTENCAFEIVVKNNKAQPINMTLQDQFPISTMKEISVDNQEAKEAEINAESQIVTWKYELPARQSKKHLMKYSVKYPKSEILQLK